jgi:predicted dehydrogenase
VTAVGVVGAGAIVRSGHLPAYRRAGFDVAAIADVNGDRAHEVARDFGIDAVYEDAEALIASDAVDVVDIAVPADAQPEIALAAVEAGKPVLCQKPLALSLDVAARVVEAAERARVPLAVNQQMRWSPLVSRAHELLGDGAIGRPERLAFDVSIHTDFAQWEFLRRTPRLEFLYHSIHYFDAIRYLLGEPTRLTAWARRAAGQATVGETRTVTVLELDDAIATISADHNDRAQPLHRAELRIVGSEGTIVGEIGLLYDYPHGRSDRIRLARHEDETAEEHALPGAWFPDAFAGPMSDLLAAAAGGPAPLTSGRDNLGTLALVLAAYDSADQQNPIDLRAWIADQLEAVGVAPPAGTSTRPIQEKEEELQ